jgi:hypothetical protein
MIKKNVNSFIIQGDSYDEKTLSKFESEKPNKLIMNPPYAQKSGDKPELGFILKGLNTLQPGGLGIVIVPMSVTFNTMGSELKDLRKELGKKGILTKANEEMIKNIRKYGNPFGDLKKGEKPKDLYCC